jgi:hypothetical protein
MNKLDPTVPQFWSCGGGTQSAAIAALIIQGKLPKPQFAAIADTERERESTWKYVDEVIVPAMAKIGVEFHRIPKSAFMTEDEPDVFTNWGQPGVLIPAFKLNQHQPASRVDGFCSSRWKRRVMQRWLRSKGVTRIDVWLGMSVDEMRRVRVSGENWYQHKYPLIFDVPMRRGECIRLVTDEMGWPEPPRSACWMCPNRGDDDWRDMKANWPVDFAKAVQFEKEMQVQRPDFYLHRSCKPLGEVDFSTQQMGFELGACESGYCFS